MDLRGWSDELEFVSAGYADYYDVERTPEWLLLKLVEEVGELSQAWLTASGQGRDRGRSAEEHAKAVRGEVADVVAMALLFARHAEVDVAQALDEKWMPYAQFHRDRLAGEQG